MIVFALLALGLAQPPETAGVSSPDIVWEAPAPAPPAAPETPPPPLPDSARADPHGYERAQCSPYVRSESESLEACQMRVRQILAAHLGDALPKDLSPELRRPDCRPGPDGHRPLECDRPRPSSPITTAQAPRTCRTAPQRQEDGRVIWTETCARADGIDEEEGLTLRLFGDRD